MVHRTVVYLLAKATAYISEGSYKKAMGALTSTLESLQILVDNHQCVDYIGNPPHSISQQACPATGTQSAVGPAVKIVSTYVRNKAGVDEDCSFCMYNRCLAVLPDEAEDDQEFSMNRSSVLTAIAMYNCGLCYQLGASSVPNSGTFYERAKQFYQKGVTVLQHASPDINEYRILKLALANNIGSVSSSLAEFNDVKRSIDTMRGILRNARADPSCRHSRANTLQDGESHFLGDFLLNAILLDGAFEISPAA
jgi:hypothetical protein